MIVCLYAAVQHVQCSIFFFSFADARATCLSRGGDLVSIVSMKEKSWLNNRLKTMSGWAYSFWLGLNDRDFPKHFYWSDGSPYKLSAWDAGYPKNTPQSESDYFRYNIIEKFPIERESNPGLHCVCFTAFCDWSRKLAPPSQPIRCKTKTNLNLVTRIFPHLRLVTCIYFEFSLCSHWLLVKFILFFDLPL